MCTVSNIGDIYGQTFPYRWPDWVPNITPSTEPVDLPKFLQMPAGVTREEFDALKAELQELKTLFLAAKKFDAKTGQPDCENANKVALFKKLAELVGVDLSEVFKS